MKKLEGKTAIITGASMGIGRCIAEAFAREGCKLMICSRHWIEIRNAAHELQATCNVPILCMECDVSNPIQAGQLIFQTRVYFSKVDILVNNAGVLGPIGSLVDNDTEKWMEPIKTNLMGTVNCVKEVLPCMIKASRGKIINFSGAGTGGKPLPTFSSYATSKMAVARFTEIVAEEVKKHNIQINAIAPGGVNTRMLNQVLDAGDRVDKAYLEKSKTQKEMGGTPPEKAAQLALYLASDESNGITGKLLSAVWDDYTNFKDSLESSIYTLRRIDNVLFTEVSR